MIAPVLITPPAALLTLTEVKAQLRIDGSHEDILLTGYIAAAAAWLDGWHGVLGRCILAQTWAIRAGALASMQLPFPDVVSAVVTYLDADGTTQVVAPADYRVRTVNGAGWLTFADGYLAPALLAGRDDCVTVTAVFGQAAAPAPLKVAALMMIAHWYQHREAAVAGVTVATVPLAVDALIAPWRVGIIG